MWNKGVVFPPRPPASVADGTVELSMDMSEMNLTEPRPKKIRRRNALTIMDGQLPSPTMGLPCLDSFESASLLQSLEDQVTFDADSSLSGEQMPGPSPFHRNATTPKRKVPRARLKASSPTFKQKHRLKEEISQIRLHRDLTNHKPNTELLPEAIVKGYRDQYQNGLLEAAKHSPSSSTALVLYQPPEKLISSILSDEPSSESTTPEDESKGEPLDCFKPIDPPDGNIDDLVVEDIEML